MVRDDIEKVVNEFKGDSKPMDRYASFDYCYNYFLTTKDLKADIEKSCLVLGFYLASWGMLRGSSFILQKSVKHLQATIEYISERDKSDWAIDVDNYDEQNMLKIKKIYKGIKVRIIDGKNADLTLITKILLGVFGFIPAFDNYFCNSFRKIANGQCGFRIVNENSLLCIHKFYNANKQQIDKLAADSFTTDFLTGKKTQINYPKAKIIDMYGFGLGLPKKTEIVFEILGEGGGIRIERNRSKSGDVFIYLHNECDHTEEGLDISKEVSYDNFEKPFQLIIIKYPWYLLHIENVHDDFRNYIIDRLIDVLNQKSILPKDLNYSIDQIEKVLKIKLIYDKNNQGEGSMHWDYEQAIQQDIC